MGRYKAKTVFTGFKLGLNNSDLYVGVPEKYFDMGQCEVVFEGEARVVSVLRADTEREFADKFRPGKKYKLLYYLWSKDET